jgi:integrase
MSIKDKITKTAVDRLQAGELIRDTKIDGFVARKLPSGSVSYGYRYRDKTTGKERWMALGVHGAKGVTAETARELALAHQGAVVKEKDPQAVRQYARRAAAEAARADDNTVDAILDTFLERHAKKLRSSYEIERVFNVYVRPRIGAKSIYELKRRDIVEMLDKVEDENGPVMADRVLAHVRKAFNWQATRDDNFSPPIVKGMARTRPTERARKRMLADDEIRDVWESLDSDGVAKPFRDAVRVLLFTAQRRGEVANMRWEEVDGDLWTVPAERYKTSIPNTVPLTERVRALLGKRKKKGFVFSSDGGRKAFNGYSKAKVALDKAIAARRKAASNKPMEHWTLHDLRRTGRSLMSRAGVPSEHAERVLGHVIPGVRGVYDRHSYADEKREALKKLAGLIDLILKPPAGNVVQFVAATP